MSYGNEIENCATLSTSVDVSATACKTFTLLSADHDQPVFTDAGRRRLASYGHGHTRGGVGNKTDSDRHDHVLGIRSRRQYVLIPAEDLDCSGVGRGQL